jgi:3-isopropylmalate/(R)-2-methylmalate dehydratase large subunit
MRQTLYDKIWRDHLVDEAPDGTCLLYVDRHLVHEVDSPQAFASLRRAGLPVKAPEKTLLVVDHNVPTSDRSKPNPDPASAAQIAILPRKPRCSASNITMSWTDVRASVTSSAPSRVLRSRAR